METDADTVAPRIDTIRFNADVISRDEVIPGPLIERDPRVVKMIDRQPAHGGVAHVDFQSDADVLNVRAVQLDEGHCARAWRGDRRAWLAVSVDDHRTVDDGQRAQRSNRLDAAAGDVEIDRIIRAQRLSDNIDLRLLIL